MLRRLTLAALVGSLVAVGCAGTDSSDQDVSISTDAVVAENASASDRLRVKGSPQALAPEQWLKEQELAHSVVRANVSLSGMFGAKVDVKVPRDFWTEVAGYTLSLDAGATASIEVSSPRVQVLVKRVGSSEILSVGQSPSVTLTAATAGKFLVMVVPMVIRPDTDRIRYDIVAHYEAPSTR